MAKRMDFSVVGLPHYTVWHLYEPSVDDIRHMEEMEQERKNREREEKERAERMKKIKEDFDMPVTQWDKDKADIEGITQKDQEAKKHSEDDLTREAPKAAAENDLASDEKKDIDKKPSERQTKDTNTAIDKSEKKDNGRSNSKGETDDVENASSKFKGKEEGETKRIKGKTVDTTEQDQDGKGSRNSKASPDEDEYTAVKKSNSRSKDKDTPGTRNSKARVEDADTSDSRKPKSLAEAVDAHEVRKTKSGLEDDDDEVAGKGTTKASRKERAKDREKRS